MNISTEANSTIEQHALWAAGAGLIPLAFADLAIISAIQMDLLQTLCRLYTVPHEEHQLKVVIGTIASTSLTRLAASSLKLIPVVGQAIGAVAMSATAGASTYAMGNLLKQHFEAGKTLDSFDFSKVKDVYDKYLKKGKDLIKRNKGKEKVNIEMAKELNDLAKLKEDGILTEEQYQEVKEKILNKYVDKQADTKEKTKPKTVKKEAQKEAKTSKKRLDDDISDKLEKLRKLKHQGILTEDEYIRLREKTLKEFSDLL